MRLPRYYSNLFWLFVSVVVLICDQWSKHWVLLTLNFNQPHAVLPFLNWYLTYNTGAAFSFLGGNGGWQIYLFLFLAAVIMIWLLGWLLTLKLSSSVRQEARKNKWVAFAIAMILGGAIGNVWDRIQYGYVVDFIDVHFGSWHYAIFNVADAAICVGVFLLVVTALGAKPKKKTS